MEKADNLDPIKFALILNHTTKKLTITEFNNMHHLDDVLSKYGNEASIFQIYNKRPDDVEIRRIQDKIFPDEIHPTKYAMILNHTTKRLIIIEFNNLNQLLDDVLTKYGHLASIFRIYDYRPEGEEITKIQDKIFISRLEDNKRPLKDQ